MTSYGIVDSLGTFYKVSCLGGQGSKGLENQMAVYAMEEVAQNGWSCNTFVPAINASCYWHASCVKGIAIRSSIEREEKDGDNAIMRDSQSSPKWLQMCSTTCCLEMGWPTDVCWSTRVFAYHKYSIIDNEHLHKFCHC